MAAYAQTTVVDFDRAERISRNFGVVTGSVDVTNYNQTSTEITDITNKFTGTNPRVVVDGISDNGYLMRWDTTDKSIHAFYPTDASDQTPTADIVAAAATEVANDVDVGVVNFHAIGLMPN